MKRDLKRKLRRHLEHRLVEAKATSLAARTTVVIREPDLALTAHAVRTALRWDAITGKPDLARAQHTHTATTNALEAIGQRVKALRAELDALHGYVEDLAQRPQHKAIDYRVAIATLRSDIDYLAVLLEDATALALPTNGKPGQVLVKTQKGVAWEWLQPQVVALRHKDTALVDNVIIDPDGNFIIDPDGNYIAALSP